MGRWCPITPVLLGLVLVDVELVPLDGVELLFRQFQLLGAAAFFRTPGGGTWGHEACRLKVGWGDRLNDPPEGCAPAPRGGGLAFRKAPAGGAACRPSGSPSPAPSCSRAPCAHRTQVARRRYVHTRTSTPSPIHARTQKNLPSFLDEWYCGTPYYVSRSLIRIMPLT